MSVSSTCDGSPVQTDAVSDVNDIGTAALESASKTESIRSNIDVHHPKRSVKRTFEKVFGFMIAIWNGLIMMWNGNKSENGSEGGSHRGISCERKVPEPGSDYQKALSERMIHLLHHDRPTFDLLLDAMRTLNQHGKEAFDRKVVTIRHMLYLFHHDQPTFRFLLHNMRHPNPHDGGAFERRVDAILREGRERAASGEGLRTTQGVQIDATLNDMADLFTANRKWFDSLTKVMLLLGKPDS
ncbi:MAG: hypothetical protein OXF02_04165 [Simkaniaceae bacterium]|nr:hypothetical protein [Simkaniaceae bacterium]